LFRDPEIKKMFCKRCNSKLIEGDTMKEFFKLKGKGKKKYSSIQCPFCLYQNKVFGAFSSSVIIKDD
jgi:RNase P subunit RPR2